MRSMRYLGLDVLATLGNRDGCSLVAACLSKPTLECGLCTARSLAMELRSGEVYVCPRHALNARRAGREGRERKWKG